MTNSETAPARRRGGKPANPPRPYACEQCGQTFTAPPANRTLAHVFCSRHCAALYRERAAGHQPPVTLPCGYCGQPVTRHASKAKSQTSKAEPANFFCNREHFLAWRRGK